MSQNQDSKNSNSKDSQKSKDSKDSKDKDKEPPAQSFLYMFEFVVDDLLITRQNLCAPEEYPTCCEISFRSSVFVSVCDREYGSCVDPSQPKCGKCCLFALESPITDKDRLLIHVYKKRTERCKFLIGITDLAVKPIFERVDESFSVENPNWEKILKDHVASLPKMKSKHKAPLDNCACYERGMERREQMCPTSELSKRLLPLFNLCKMQTGNIVLIMRLVCNGPAVVSTFPFNRVCSRNPKGPEPCPAPCPTCPSCGKKNPSGSCPPARPSCGSDAAGAASGGGGKCKKCCKAKSRCPVCVMPDPCAKDEDDLPKCLRYFACNLDKLCPCDYCEDEFDRECPTVPSCKKKSPIEQRLATCGPCGNIPAMPTKRPGDKPEPPPKDTKDNKDAKDGKDSKDKKDKKGKGRQKGGGLCPACESQSSCSVAQERAGCLEMQCDCEAGESRPILLAHVHGS